MLLCAGVLQPITGGKGTKREQTSFFAQHKDVHGSCTRQPEQLCHSRCGTGAWGMLSIIISLFPEHLPSHTLCSLHWNSQWNRGGGALVSQGSLCPCPEPDEMMTQHSCSLEGHFHR